MLVYMKEVMLKEILKNLSRTIEILEKRDAKDSEELRELSDKAIEGVALYKDLDMISVTVLIYSIYKVLFCLDAENYEKILKELQFARKHLQSRRFGMYNRSIKRLYRVIQHCNASVKEHLQDVMQAARVKKGMVLLQKGLSIGQAAGLMGLSNWDLQKYAAGTPALTGHSEKIHAHKRLEKAMKLFGVQG